MSQIARLHDAEITDGNIVDADDLDDEFNQLISESNAQDLRITAIETIDDTANTWTQTQTFSEATNPIKTDIISERTSGAGVTNDGVRCKDGMVKVAGTPASAGEIGYASNLLTFYNGTTVKTIATVDTAATMPKGYLAEVPPVWQSASTVRVPAGFRCRDDSDAADIVVASNLDVVLSGSGALGLDTAPGVGEASGTFYRLWVCKGDSGVTAVFSTSLTSPTLPTGYSTYKRLLPGAWRNDGSSNLIRQYYLSFGVRSEIRYHVLMQGYGGTVGPTNILDGGTSSGYSSFADLTATATYVPAESQLGVFKVDGYGNTYSVAMRPNGYTTDDFWVRTTTGTNQFIQDVIYIPTDSSQLVEVKTSTGDGLDIAVAGYVVTQYTNGLT